MNISRILCLLPVFAAMPAMADQAKCIANSFPIVKITKDYQFSSPLFELEISNKSPFAIRGIIYRILIEQEGRSIPWHDDEAGVEINGGIDKGETRSVGVGAYGAPDDMPKDAKVTISITDVADKDLNQTVGKIKIMGWGNGQKSPICPD